MAIKQFVEQAKSAFRAGQLAAADSICRQILSEHPQEIEPIYILGRIAQANHRHSEAVEWYSRVMELSPDHFKAANNLGSALADCGRVAESVQLYRRVVNAHPDSPEAHYNLGMMLLMQGDFAEGWREYEWRHQIPQLRSPSPPQNKPRWDGSSLAGRRILLYTEQGAGDAIQFARYIPLVAQRGASRIALAVTDNLFRLFESLSCADLISAWIKPGERTDDFDIYFPVMSLPLLFGSPTSSPELQKIPYLHANAESIIRWKALIPATPGKIKIGLVWAGDPIHKNDHNRSMQVSLLEPWKDIPNAVFYSLQKGPAAAQAANPPAGLHFIDHSAQLTDFAETAALISLLDLVITIDTSVAHLAGAVGKPTWVMLPWVSDWRWLLNRSDSPWYPTMRLYRQPTPGNWDAVLQQIRQDLTNPAVLRSLTP